MDIGELKQKENKGKRKCDKGLHNWYSALLLLLLQLNQE
jgi:hypothetical protein